MGTREQYMVMIRLQVYERRKEQVKRGGRVCHQTSSSRHGESSLQFLEFRILGLLCRRMACLDVACTRRGVNWCMLCAHESLVESVLLELLELRFEFVLRAGVCGNVLARPHIHIHRYAVLTSSISSPALSGLDIAFEISSASSRCSLISVIVASTLFISLWRRKIRGVGRSLDGVGF